MTEANPFDAPEFSEVRTPQPPDQQDDNGPNPFESDDMSDPNVLKAGPRPTFGERFSAHLNENLGGLGEKIRPVIDRATVNRGNTAGTFEGPGNVFATDKVPQAGYDAALARLAAVKADRDRFESMPAAETPADYAAAVFGSVAALPTQPENLLLGGGGKGAAVAIENGAPVLSRILLEAGKEGAKFAGFSGATDAASQGLDMAAGWQDHFDNQRLLMSTALGFGLGSTVGGGVAAIKAIRGTLPEQVARSVDEALGTPRAPRAPMVEPDKIGTAPAEPRSGDFSMRYDEEASSPSAQAQPTRPLDERLDAYADEARAMPDDSTFDERGFRQPGLQQALIVASRVQGILGDEGRRAIDIALANGRRDVAEAIVERAERAAETSDTTPGVSEANPKYEEIKADLLRRKQEKADYADELRAKLGEAQSKFADELKGAGVKPEHIDADLARRAEASGNTDLAAAHEDAALAREYETSEGRELVRTHYGKFKVKEPLKESAPSLITFLKNNGGLKPNKDLDSIFGRGSNHQKGKGRLINKNGQNLDDALKAAAEAGYLRGDHQSLSVADLLDAIGEDAGGRKVYPEGKDKASLATEHAYNRQTAELDAAEKHVRDQVKFSDEAEPPPDAVWRDAAAHMVFGGERDPHVAFDRAVLDYEREAGHEIHGGTASEHGDGAGKSRLERAGYDEEGRFVGSRDEFPGFEPTGSEPGSRETTGTGGTGRTEAGADGKPQQLIPGVEPVTDRQRTELAASKPLKGGDAPVGGMFDEANTRQSEMFLRSGNKAVGPAADFRRRSNREVLPGEAETKVGPREAVSDEAARNLNLDASMKHIAASLGRRLEMDGRMTKGALGTYKPMQGVLRIRYSGDVDVFAHELGHAVDQMLDSSPVTRDAWQGLKTAQPSELMPLDMGTGKLEEGAAEFLRGYITNPAWAARVAPDTTAAFQAILAKADPAIAKALKATADLSRIESGLTPTQAAEAMIAPQSNGALAKFSREMRRQGFVPTVADYASAIYQKLIGADNAFARYANQMNEARFQKRGPQQTLEATQDPYVLYRRLPNAESAAVGMVRDGVRPYGDPFAAPVSPSLTSALEKALGANISRLERDDDPVVSAFNAYLIARRARSEWARFESGELRNQPVRMSKNEVLSAIKEYEAKYPNFQSSGDDVFTFMRSHFQRQVDAGIIPRDVAESVLNRSTEYVPFWRDFEGEKAGSSGGRKGAGLEYSPVMQFQGSTRDILNPVKSIIESVGIGERLIARNDVWASLDRWAEQAGEFAGPLWEHVPNTELRGETINIANAVRAKVRENMKVLGHNGGQAIDADMAVRGLENLIGEDLTARVFHTEGTTANGERVAFFWKNGERQAVKVGDTQIAKDFFDLMTAMSAPEKDLFIKTVGAANGMFQSMIVHAPRFMIGTMVRDNMTRMFTPRYMSLAGRLPMMQDMKGVYTLMFDRAFYKAWASNGAIRGGVYAHAAREIAGGDPMKAVLGGEPFYRRAADDFRSAGTALGKIKAIASTPAKIMSDMTKLIESSETISRLGVSKLTFDYLKKQGLNDADALAAAIHESNDMLDYGRKGSGVKTLTRLVPFLNPGIQGADRAARGLTAEPIMTAIKAYQRGGYEQLDMKDKLQLANAFKNWLMIGSAAGVTGALYYPYVKDTPFYQRASEYMRENYWLIQTGTDANGDPVGLTIHKPYDEPSVFINAVENYFKGVHDNDPRTFWRTMSALKEALPREFRSAGEALGAFTFPKTAFELYTGTRLGFGNSGPRQIVPDRLRALPPEMQQDAMSSWISKKMGEIFHVSPKMVDYAIDSVGGTGGQDVRDLTSAIFDDNPLRDTKSALNRGFFGQVWRTQRGSPAFKNDLQELIARDHGSYARQAEGYKEQLKYGNYDDAERIYNNADDGAKAYMMLQSSFKFPPNVRQLNPLQRTSTIASIAYSMMRDLGDSQIAIQDRRYKRGEERGVIDLTPDEARKINTQLNQIVTEETRNGLTIIGQPGYEGFSIIDTSPRVEIIRQVSKAAGDELAKRLTQNNVLPAEGVAATWPEAQSRLLADKQKARLGDLVAKAKTRRATP